MSKTYTPEELSEKAWKMISEGLTTGTMTLETGREITLDSVALIHLAQWLSTSKAKRPRPVSTPEDFVVRQTTEETENG